MKKLNNCRGVYAVTHPKMCSEGLARPQPAISGQGDPAGPGGLPRSGASGAAGTRGGRERSPRTTLPRVPRAARGALLAPPPAPLRGLSRRSRLRRGRGGARVRPAVRGWCLAAVGTRWRGCGLGEARRKRTEDRAEDRGNWALVPLAPGALVRSPRPRRALSPQLQTLTPPWFGRRAPPALRAVTRLHSRRLRARESCTLSGVLVGGRIGVASPRGAPASAPSVSPAAPRRAAAGLSEPGRCLRVRERVVRGRGGQGGRSAPRGAAVGAELLGDPQRRGAERPGRDVPRGLVACPRLAGPGVGARLAPGRPVLIAGLGASARNRCASRGGVAPRGVTPDTAAVPTHAAARPSGLPAAMPAAPRSFLAVRGCVLSLRVSSGGCLGRTVAGF